MALTVSNIDSFSEDTWGRHRVRLVEVTFDASYASGGESFTAADVGLAEIVTVFLTPLDSGYQVTWDRASETLRVFGQEPTSGTTGVIEDSEETAATDLSSLVVHALVVGH